MSDKHLVFVGLRKAEIQEFNLPEALAFGECRLRITHSLISPGTELSMYRTERTDPLAPGYTAAGIVEKCGEGLDAGLLGKTVFCFPVLKDSMHCHASRKNVARDGLLIPVPDGMDAGKACFARLINVAMTPFCHLDPKISGTALVVGLGLVGNLAAQIAGLRGFRVIGMDPDAARRQRALDAGVPQVIDPSAGDGVEQVRALTGGEGAMLTINATGVTATFPTAIQATATGGELSTLGGARGQIESGLQAFLHDIQFRHVTVRGGWEMLLPRRSSPADRTPSTERNLHQAMEWLKTDRLNLKPLWTHTLRPDALPAAYAALDRADPNYLGVVVDWR